MNLANIVAMLQNRKPAILGAEHYFKSAILLPLIETEGKIELVFEVRSMNLRQQPGDICFPGGRMDEGDPDAEYCAIRETTEELGIAFEDIENVFPLDYVVSEFGRIIYPFVGTIKNPDKIIPNRAEVDEVFTVPLDFLLHTAPEKYKVGLQVVPEDDFPFELIVGGRNYNWQIRHIEELFYQYNGKVIWGLTAKILHHFLTLLQK